jgi:excinuclease ABC subunit C
MVGAMIVAGPEGFIKKAYRKFNIRQAKNADDYGMMCEVMRRRFSKVERQEGDAKGEDWPDLILIDGGLGQLNAVGTCLEGLGIAGDLSFVAIAKGEDRNAGREKFFMPAKDPFQLPINDPVLQYLQRLRDEAHRFAIGAHRTRRAMQIKQSLLDDVPGIGAKRKKALLMHFGSAKAVQDAGLNDLEKVDGISKEVARKIYSYFHETS